MKMAFDNSIESLILDLLKDSPLSSIDLIARMQKKRQDTPKQSVYLALRKLKQREMITIGKKLVSLHQVWVSQMKNFFLDAERTYSQGANEVSFLRLEEKESAIYKFNSLLSLDMFWAHAVALFMNERRKGDSIFFYNPHQWFLIVRNQSESYLISEAARRDISWVQLIAGKTPLDIETRTFFDQEKARCHLLGEDVYPSNYYLNVLGDFTIEVWLDSKVAQEIEKVYSEYKTITPELQDRLQKLIEVKKYRHKMKISRNSQKVKKVQSVFGKYFFISTTSATL
jgi:DNA-binding PadR family transcriptional regulator